MTTPTPGSSATATMPLETPIGRLVLECDGDVLIGVWLPHERRHGRRDADDLAPVLKETATQLEEYFAGERRDFDVPMELDGTPFQREVWAELSRIPYGRPSATASWRAGSAARARPAPSARPTGATRSPSSSPATGCWPATGSAATAAG